MNNLPYLQPDKDYFYNFGILVLIIESLARTKRDKLVLNIDKLQTFYFLVTRPVFLNKVLLLANKKQLNISISDYHTVDTISPNIEELFNRKKITTLLKGMSRRDYIRLSFDGKDGFLFELSEKGKNASEQLSDGYFKNIKNFTNSLLSLQSESSPKLNLYINTILKQGM
jgi:hypothetical protein